jgi:excisionase family DNA binding protein
MTKDIEPLWKVEDACRFLRLSRITVYRMISADKIPHVRIGRKIFFLRESLETWVEGKQRGGKKKTRTVARPKGRS